MTEPLPEYGGCPWPLDPGCLEDDWSVLEPDQQDRATMLASNTLHRLTGLRVGGCPVKIRPCKPVTCGGAFVPFVGRSSFYPGMNTSGAWVNNACGACSSCTSGLCEVDLPGPVGRVDEVRVNGTVLDAQDYEVQNGHILVYTGSETPCPFPATQDLALADTEAGTFSVTYLNAYPVSREGAYAAGLLAMEFAKACGKNPRNCRLPASVVNVVRAGLTYTIQPGLFPDGFTGINEVDSFIGDWNPRALIQESQIWSPDQPQTRITTAGGS